MGSVERNKSKKVVSKPKKVIARGGESPIDNRRRIRGGNSPVRRHRRNSSRSPRRNNRRISDSHRDPKRRNRSRSVSSSSDSNSSSSDSDRSNDSQRGPRQRYVRSRSR